MCNSTPETDYHFLVCRRISSWQDTLFLPLKRICRKYQATHWVENTITTNIIKFLCHCEPAANNPWIQSAFKTQTHLGWGTHSMVSFVQPGSIAKMKAVPTTLTDLHSSQQSSKPYLPQSSIDGTNATSTSIVNRNSLPSYTNMLPPKSALSMLASPTCSLPIIQSSVHHLIGLP